ncbi:MAG: cation transporter [Anaerolineae bacterium]|jgi:cobalt-zinc-cadmium efflux system protein|nr:cation transporter [Anaerolineae bacterium]MBT7069884.1 cation transporter [Anaerolineae bacterium]MBT7325060.1 cation transporter [Anaerolineae bacterium]
MSHSHTHTHHHTENIRTAFFLNLGFTLFEIVGGIYTNSLAITSDALHDLGDSISLGMAWYLEKHSQKESDQKYSYGYRRFSLLAALINTTILVIGSLYILTEAIPRLLAPEETNAGGMIVLAIVGIAVNGMAVLRVRKGQSLNAQVVAWHLLEDVLGWVAVLIVSIGLLVTDLYILDPILSVLINLYVLYNVFGNLRKTLALFLQAVPDSYNLPDIEHGLAKIAQVLSVHHTHIWSLDGEDHVLTTHLVVDPDANKEDLVRIKNSVREVTKDLSLAHSTVELEFEEDCSMSELDHTHHDHP